METLKKIDWKWYLGTVLALISIITPILLSRNGHLSASIETLEQVEQKIDAMQTRVYRQLVIAEEDGYYAYTNYFPEDPGRLASDIGSLSSALVKDFTSSSPSRFAAEAFLYSDINLKYIASTLKACDKFRKRQVYSLKIVREELYILKRFTQLELLRKRKDITRRDMKSTQDDLIKRSKKKSVSHQYSGLPTC